MEEGSSSWNPPWTDCTETQLDQRQLNQFQPQPRLGVAMLTGDYNYSVLGAPK